MTTKVLVPLLCAGSLLPLGSSLARADGAPTPAAGAECGLTETTIDARQRECAQQSGSTKVSQRGVTWSLVARRQHGATGQLDEVWRDSHTGLLWGDRLEGYFTHLEAVTLTQAGAAVQVTDEKACRGALGQRANAQIDELPFNLPTANEFDQAERDGVRQILPHFLRTDMEHYRDRFWTATLMPEATPQLSYSVKSNSALAYDSRDFGNSEFETRETRFSVRCVARPPAPVAEASPVPLAGRVECGTTGAGIEERIKDCARLPRSVRVSSATPVTWNLVTRRLAPETGLYAEVWRDGHTGRLWGELLEREYTHYDAVEMKADGTVARETACSSAEGQRANGQLPGLAFRLPTKEDLQEVRADGDEIALRGAGTSLWTSSLSSGRMLSAFTGEGATNDRWQFESVRCVSASSVSLAAPVGPAPLPECGTQGALADRITSCGAQPGSLWESESHVRWLLVVRKREGTAGPTHEVWEDTSTGLLWGDTLDQPYRYREAAKACSEKAGVRANAELPKLPFALPTRDQYTQARRDGILDALPNLRGRSFWSASPDACVGDNWVDRHLPHLTGANPDVGRGTAFLFHALDEGEGLGATAFCDQPATVRCVAPSSAP